MEYTDQQKQEFKEQYAALSRRQIIATVPFVVILIAAVIFGEGDFIALSDFQETMLFIFFALGVVGMLIFSLKNWRCPACKSYLGRGLGPKFCSKCGVALK